MGGASRDIFPILHPILIMENLTPKVVQIHLDERFVEAGRVNTAAMRLLSRLGYLDYATIERSWRMERPD